MKYLIETEIGFVTACLILYKSDCLVGDIHKMKGDFRATLDKVNIENYLQKDTTFFQWNGESVNLALFIPKHLEEWWENRQDGYVYSIKELAEINSKYPDLQVRIDRSIKSLYINPKLGD